MINSESYFLPLCFVCVREFRLLCADEFNSSLSENNLRSIFVFSYFRIFAFLLLRLSSTCSSIEKLGSAMCTECFDRELRGSELPNKLTARWTIASVDRWQPFAYSKNQSFCCSLCLKTRGQMVKARRLNVKESLQIMVNAQDNDQTI